VGEPPQPAVEDQGAEAASRRQRRQQLLAQQASLERCERQFGHASRTFRNVMHHARSQPDQAGTEVRTLIGEMVADMTGEREVAIRLLSEKAGEETSLHALNVTVLSVLLGRACGLDEAALQGIGVGALLHDLGKLDLPDRLRWSDDPASPSERKLFQQHVGHGVALAQRMGLDPVALQVIAQHHELADGSGYPLGLKGEAIEPGARIVALVNQYDNLCNPGNPAQAITPHDALAIMFARQRSQFDATIMAVFIRMMGVYPPGSVVQLTDSRYALSVAVNPMRPLKPRVVVYDTEVPADQALILDLEDFSELGVQRSLKPLQLPRAVFDYLSPRKRMCYFFERSRDPFDPAAAA
jgi:putative nucleotidyltransferase with HDIG domain